ncbi:Phytanoyl-CoA dioxygenase (PhyH) [Seminavis robusta]|uniref:Phytanoyl-CoA dioxygenase (PhyH) n=1 Tax=Seminavis robusta TaxID=568900 RepID=A0A9N8E7T2_9STRA|nr:Phytanoyl-CoA dioxygenase (PhyH) [Seminavis robusta]|eukprot:Sro604_g174120.1 Phytanoyl-CoA dioxygenase (PhyH) (459) ;mRNA; f:30442-31902
MNHLKSSQERKDRWYARHIVPKFVPVEKAERWEDLWQHGYSVVKSVPFEWLCCKEEDESCEGKVGQSPCQRLRHVLDYHGFAVISGVLQTQECDDILGKAWDWIEAASEAEFMASTRTVGAVSENDQNGNSELNGMHNGQTTSFPPVHRKDKSTLESKFFPRSVEGGMMPFYGSGHSSFAWTVRSHKNVRRVFEVLHDGEKDLLASLDGIVLWRRGEHHRTDPGWFHLDQNPRCKPGPQCIQGLVNLLPASPQTGGNVLVAQSHKLFPQHYTTPSIHSCSNFYRQRLDELGDEDWMEIDPNDTVVLGDASKVISCMLGPGDVLLWDSRTVHCSNPPTVSKETELTSNGLSETATPPQEHSSGLIRAACVVSMMPASSVSTDVLQARQESVEQNRTLTHWVNKVAPLGAEHQDHVQKEKACIQAMKQLATKKGVSCTLLGFQDLSEAQQRLVVGSRLLE